MNAKSPCACLQRGDSFSHQPKSCTFEWSAYRSQMTSAVGSTRSSGKVESRLCLPAPTGFSPTGSAEASHPSAAQCKQWEVHLKIFKNPWAASSPAYQAQQKGTCWPPRPCASAQAHLWSTDPAAEGHLYTPTVAPYVAKPSTIINSKAKKKNTPKAPTLWPLWTSAQKFGHNLVLHHLALNTN